MEDFHALLRCLSGVKLQALADAAENYHSLLAENRKLFNELQDLKGATKIIALLRLYLREIIGVHFLVFLLRKH